QVREAHVRRGAGEPPADDAAEHARVVEPYRLRRLPERGRRGRRRALVVGADGRVAQPVVECAEPHGSGKCAHDRALSCAWPAQLASTAMRRDPKIALRGALLCLVGLVVTGLVALLWPAAQERDVTALQSIVELHRGGLAE